MIDGGLRLCFRKYLPRIMFTSIESASTEAGIPDLFYCCEGGITGWIELKATDNNTVAVRPGQIAWNERYTRMGGRSFIAVRYRRNNLLIYRGAAVRDLQSLGLRLDVALLYCDGGPKNWQWDKIEKILAT